MAYPTKNPVSPQHASKPTTWRRWVFWLGFLTLVIINGVAAFRHRRSGEDWLSAFGFAFDQDLLQILGDAAVPLIGVVFIRVQVMRLPPSREKTVLTWLTWSLFLFLLAWWSLHIALFGSL